MTGDERLREALGEVLSRHRATFSSRTVIYRRQAVAWREGLLDDLEAAARDALAVAPEPSYQWRVCGLRGLGGQWRGLPRPSEPEWWEMPELRKRSQEVWVERRAAVVGPWERVEVEDGEG